MKATSARAGTFRQTIAVRQHRVVADEPADQGGATPDRARRSCSPRASPPARRSRWRCTPSARAGTSRRRGRLRLQPGRARSADEVRAHAALPGEPDRGAGRAPEGHRGEVPGAPDARRRGHVRRACRARLDRGLSSPPRSARPCSIRPRRPRSTSTAVPMPRSSCRCTSMGASCTSCSRAAATTSAATPARCRSRAAARTTRRTCARPRCARPRRRSGCRATPSR